VWSATWTNGILYGLDPVTGAQKFHTNLGIFAHFATPSAAGGKLFFANRDRVTAPDRQALADGAQAPRALPLTDLGTFGLDPVGEAINSHGVIVGLSGNGAFVWSAGTFQALNNLIPPGSGFVLTDATAINDNGQIVANGYSTTNYQTHAFLLTPTG
jgi:probable HAF family extracellular repeat protein